MTAFFNHCRPGRAYYATMRVSMESYDSGDSYRATSRGIGGCAKTRKCEYWPGQGVYPGLVCLEYWWETIGFICRTLDLNLRRAGCKNKYRGSKTRSKMLMIQRAWGGDGGRYLKTE
jgi:hypothetical protein